jgi:hypothetical protein
VDDSLFRAESLDSLTAFNRRFDEARLAESPRCRRTATMSAKGGHQASKMLVIAVLLLMKAILIVLAIWDKTCCIEIKTDAGKLAAKTY